MADHGMICEPPLLGERRYGRNRARAVGGSRGARSRDHATAGCLHPRHRGAAGACHGNLSLGGGRDGLSVDTRGVATHEHDAIDSALGNKASQLRIGARCVLVHCGKRLFVTNHEGPFTIERIEARRRLGIDRIHALRREHKLHVRDLDTRGIGLATNLIEYTFGIGAALAAQVAARAAHYSQLGFRYRRVYI